VVAVEAILQEAGVVEVEVDLVGKIILQLLPDKVTR
jgi:hypothetical protein